MTFSDELIGRIVNSDGEEREAMLQCAALENDPVLQKICSLGKDFTIPDLLKALPFAGYIRCLELSNQCAASQEVSKLKSDGKTRHLRVFTKYLN